ncbi:GATA-type zinc finger protein 1 [Megalops cyprinoides]|uniref:GATA-type zinc finger protein 1 n=1 Tax=Megalops cyprinoides TaxID=118141 RepID=UPI001864C594|nr:GATA-type zinc finger protein 1 [Megalops cyprinoides]
MNTGSEMSNAFRKGTKNEQDIQDHQVPQSVILYLLQEATKLASPSDSARYASTSHFNSYCQLDSEPQKSYTGSFSVMHSQPSSSPWEVMSLINLQCERLLCPVDGKDVEMNSVAAAPAFEDRGCSFKKSKSTGHSGELSGFMEGNTSHAVPQHDVKGRGRMPRKQSHPTRSADLSDPDFQGVTFHMHAELNDSRDQCRLLITSNYSAELLKGRRRERRSRPRSLVSCLKSSSSEEESDCSGLSKNKVCASCNTKKTPLWRDAEDGTPLCNACGIRYKKYRIRCFQCWNIPRKESNSNLKCHKCGDALRLATSHRKLTSW